MWDHLKKRSSYQALSTIIETKKSTTLHRDLNHPAFYSIQITRPSSAVIIIRLTYPVLVHLQLIFLF